MSPRNLTPDMASSAQLQTGRDLVHLIYLEFEDPVGGPDPVRLTTSDDPRTVDVGDGAGAVVWSPWGGKIDIDTIPETGDFKKYGATITFPSVRLDLLVDALTKYYIGRSIQVYRMHVVSGTSTIVAGPAPFFSGEMNGGWDYDEKRPKKGPMTATLKLKALSDLARADEVRGVQTNTPSYRRFFPEFADDTLYDVVPENAKKQQPWGKQALEGS